MVCLHHRLNDYRSGIQSKRITSLVNTFDSLNLQFTGEEDDCLYHIVTGRIFPNTVRDHVLAVFKTGKELQYEFEEKCVKPLSTTSIWSPLKRVNLVGFKKSDKPTPLKLEIKIH